MKHKEMTVGTFIVLTILGIIVGSYLSQLLGLLPGDHNVVRDIFTYSLPITIGDFSEGALNPWLINLGVIQLQVGFLLNINFISFVGLFATHWVYRAYR